MTAGSESAFIVGMFLVATMFLFSLGFFISVMRAKKTDDLGDKVRESYNYRKHLTNMFVAGKVKQEADKEGVDLDKETKGFEEYMKMFCQDKGKDLDDKIEDKINSKSGS